jgi:hypothetical protein
MAGGMGRARGLPLSERQRAGQGAPPPNSTKRTEGPSILAKHVWLVDAPGQPGRWPGLLVEWRQAPDGTWEARVVHAVPEADRSGIRVIERWLPATALEPVQDTPASDRQDSPVR